MTRSTLASLPRLRKITAIPRWAAGFADVQQVQRDNLVLQCLVSAADWATLKACVDVSMPRQHRATPDSEVSERSPH